MNKQNFKHSICQIFFTAVITLVSQQALASAILTSNISYSEGDYYIVDIYGNSISDFSSGGVDFGGGSFPSSPQNYSSGDAGGDIDLNLLYDFDDNFFGSGYAGANVEDPYNQLSFIQIDGDSVVDFSFSITMPHTYTLTGNLSANDFGHVSLFFDSVTLTEADTTDFSLTGTLAAGEYSFLIDSSNFLTSPGSSYSSYDFNLQLSEVPLPAAFWLFGSGLIALSGFSGVARAKEKTGSDTVLAVKPS